MFPQYWSDQKLKFLPDGRPKENEENRLPRVTSDVDGVWANFTELMCQLHNKKYGTDIHWTEWNTWKPWENDPPLMTQKQSQEHFETAFNMPDMYRHLDIFYDVDPKKVQKDLDNNLYLLHFVTHRANLIADEGILDSCRLTQLWFQDHGLVPTGVIAGHQERYELLQQLESDYHLDDYGDEFLKLRKKGINAYLIDRPWNQDIDTEYRVKSFDEFLLATVFNKQLEAKAL